MSASSRELGFWGYWGRVACRAWADTLAFYPIFKDRPKAAIRIVGQSLAAVILACVASSQQMIEEINVWWAFALANMAVFLLLLAWNAAMAPSRLYREIYLENTALKKSAAAQEGNLAAAEELRSSLRQVEGIVSGASRSTDIVWLDSVAQDWEQGVLKIMREHNLPEQQIHMFESISTIPRGAIRLVGGPNSDQIISALDAKRAKLRLIIARLLA
ncbi:MAG: hypothetical protein AB7P12_01990 [Alphaproteobacteria bacterium]